MVFLYVWILFWIPIINGTIVLITVKLRFAIIFFIGYLLVEHISMAVLVYSTPWVFYTG